ncbi:Uncharacterised protein [Mycobacteroides abscessus subsp. bolletii]|uniref:hypothetical protein n=1 Tax=Mycobacteroides abscessus TaxID=36809 RepID=UPI0009A6CB3C|nr:hypothetical protein [Mycobacteroides abscessus]SLE94644.1 Uncharacterised protein [Mycobacteroides abscessus subsp. bolletii]
MSGRDDSDEDVAFKSGILAHLAAHEPQHIVLTLAGLGLGEVAAAARGESDTVNTFLLAAAEAVNEYQAELAANRIVLSPLPHTAEALSEDLATFRASLAEAAGLVSTDYERVCSTVFTVAKELLKGVAYAAAYRFHAGDDRSEPDPRPEGWDRYLDNLWPDLMNMFATIPPAGGEVEMTQLAGTVYRMAERVMNWLETIGFKFVADAEGNWRSWWNVVEPV